MTAREETIDPDDWLRHAAALRRLAASLIRDEHEAEDLVQETWLRARREDAAHGTPWFRSVLRNLARDRFRERGRREGSEHGAARSECLPSESDVLEQLEVAQRVAAEVARLEEPYRTAIHLRYFEDLAPEEIARISGVPPETARTRLRRGLEALRRRMDHAYGGRREAWALALSPLHRAAMSSGVAGGQALAATGAIMGTKLVLSSAAALVVVAGLFLVRQHSQGGESRGEPRSGPESPPSLAVDAELNARVATALGGFREALPTTTASPGLAGDASATVAVHGTVVIEDEKGEEHASESGTLTIACFRSEADVRTEEVEVARGSWSLSLQEGELLVVLKLVASGREALLPEPRPLAPGPNAIAVRGKWLARGWLRVVDAKTREELRSIEIRCAEGWRANPAWTHPGDDPRVKTVVVDGASPVELPDRKWLTPYWVHAPGHAWARVDFDHRTGGQRTVELSPAPSSVVVTVVGGDLPEAARVRLYPRYEGGVMVLEGMRFRVPDRLQDVMAAVSVRAVRDGPVRIDDLQAGGYVAAIETGEYEETLRLGEAAVEVEPDGVAFVTVAFDPALLNVPRTHLHGTIEVPAELDRARCWIRLERIGGGEKPFERRLNELSFPRGDEGRLRWDAGSVRTGDYIAKVRGIEHRQLIHALGPGETRVAIIIPPLVTLTVVVVDARTRARIEPDELRWRGAELEGGPGFELLTMLPDPLTGRFQITAPQGEVEVSCRARGYRDTHEKVVLEGRETTWTLVLERATGVRIVMRGNDSPLGGLDYLARICVVREDGAEVRYWHGTTTAAESTRFVSEPGRYRIEFPALEGIEPIQPRTVDLREGEMVDVSVMLARRD